MNWPRSTWANMFDADIYPTFASGIADRPYLEAYDFMERSDAADTSFAPAHPRFRDFITECDVSFPDGSRFFEGSASGVDGRP